MSHQRGSGILWMFIVMAILTMILLDILPFIQEPTLLRTSVGTFCGFVATWALLMAWRR